MVLGFGSEAAVVIVVVIVIVIEIVAEGVLVLAPVVLLSSVYKPPASALSR